MLDYSWYENLFYLFYFFLFFFLSVFPCLCYSFLFPSFKSHIFFSFLFFLSFLQDVIALFRHYKWLANGIYDFHYHDTFPFSLSSLFSSAFHCEWKKEAVNHDSWNAQNLSLTQVPPFLYFFIFFFLLHTLRFANLPLVLSFFSFLFFFLFL